MPSHAPTPTVSVILPCCERLRFVRCAAASVFAQTLADWELIIVDDGSGSAVQEYLLDVAVDARVRTLRLPHTGNPAVVRNAGLKRAEGKYVAVIDSDDVWTPCKLEIQVASLRRSKELRWGYTAYRYSDASGEVSRAVQTLIKSTTYSWPYARWWASALYTIAASLSLGLAKARSSLPEQSGS